MGFQTPAILRHRVGAPDGWVLDVAEVPSANATVDGPLVICGHAMMVDRRSMLREDRPSLCRTLAEAGCHLLVPDLRGHGMSGPTPRAGGHWTYGDLVSDVGALLDLARRVCPQRPIFLLGHSLFGHVALAWLTRHRSSGEYAPAPVNGVVLLAVNMWHKSAWGAPQSTRQRMEKAGTMLATMGLARMRGFMPSTWTGPRAMDEASDYWAALYDSAIHGLWGASNDGYRAGLADLHVPVLHVVSEGDRINARPQEADAFLAPLPDRTLWHLGKPGKAPRQLSELSPDHMRIVTHPSSEPLWTAVAQWVLERSS